MKKDINAGYYLDEEITLRNYGNLIVCDKCKHVFTESEIKNHKCNKEESKIMKRKRMDICCECKSNHINDCVFCGDCGKPICLRCLESGNIDNCEYCENTVCNKCKIITHDDENICGNCAEKQCTMEVN